MPVRLTQAQADTIKYHLDILYSMAAGYAYKMADLALDDAEQTLLQNADHKKTVAKAMASIKKTLEWDIVPDATERSCP